MCIELQRKAYRCEQYGNGISWRWEWSWVLCVFVPIPRGALAALGELSDFSPQRAFSGTIVTHVVV